jgi:hypothetical protein
MIELEQGHIAGHTLEYHRPGLLILVQLSTALHLPESENLTKAHELQTPFTSSMSFLRYVDHAGRREGGHDSHTMKLSLSGRPDASTTAGSPT